MKVTTKTIVGRHPKHGKSNGQRILPRIRAYTVPATVAHPVISDIGAEFPCSYPFGCDQTAHTNGGRCTLHARQTLPTYRPVRADGTPLGVLSTGRLDTTELREVSRREKADMQHTARTAKRIGDKERARIRAAKERASRRAA